MKKLIISMCVCLLLIIPTSIVWADDDYEWDLDAGGYYDITVNPGDTVVLRPTVTGSDLSNLTYQWYDSEYEEIDGATNSTFTVDNPKTGDRYSVCVTNRLDSDWAYFDIEVDNDFCLVIPDARGKAGGTITLNAKVTGKDLSKVTYKWYKYDRELKRDVIIEGATSSKYVISNADANNTDGIYCEVDDGYGNTDSDSAYIEVINDLKVSNKTPYKVTVKPFESVTMEVTVTANDTSGLTYQWYYEENDDFVTIEGATAASYTVPEVSRARTYCCEVTDAYDYCADVSFEVCVDTGMKVYTDNSYICGNGGAKVTLKVIGTVNLGTLHYKWYKLNSNYDIVATYSVSNPTLSVTIPSTKELIYFCEVTDDYGQTEIIDFYVMPHNWVLDGKSVATFSKDGYAKYYCDICYKTKKDTLYKLKSVSASSATYTGKALKTTITVKDSKGKVVSSKYYTATYKNNTKIGVATVTVKFKGLYSGSKSVTFKINPKGTSISSLTAGTKKFTVKWKKQSTQTTGYQIQYATNSKFSSPKTVIVKKNSTISQSISKLTAKKKYYVRIRTYKTVSGKTYYSGWSTVKAVTTK